jgi:hypothetical protein
MMGIQYLDNTWLVRQPAEEAWPAAATAADWAELRYHAAATATLLAALALMASPMVVASMAIAGILR